MGDKPDGAIAVFVNSTSGKSTRFRTRHGAQDARKCCISALSTYSPSLRIGRTPSNAPPAS